MNLPLRALCALLVVLLWAVPAHAQGYQCRTSPVGASTNYCASEAFVSSSLAAAPQGTVTEQKNTAGAGLATSGNCDNTSTNASSPCQYALALNSATLQASPSNPTGTSSGTASMMGLGGTCKITPVYSTRVTLSFKGQLSNTGTGSTIVQVRYGTGSAPLNGVAAAGTAFGQLVEAANMNSGYIVPFEAGGNITGLTAGTAYWFDMTQLVGSGTGTAINLSCSAVEF